MINYDWIFHRTVWAIRFLKKKLLKKKTVLDKYYDKEILDISNTNQKIRQFLISGEPFMAGRLGSTELNTMVAYQKECNTIFYKRYMNQKIIKSSGFFYQRKDEVRQFVELMEASCKQADLLGVWFNNMEDYIVDKYCRSDCLIGRLAGLEPWYSEKEPWSELLEGKRVVIVHPFKASMEKQIVVRDKLFANKAILPECQIRFVKAVQTLVGNRDEHFETWFEALESMYSEVMKEEFDIAIIGCGAYGFPLAAKIKKAGKPAIHLGGATQLFMGIKGRRWDNHPVISKLYNDYWIRPLPEDVPENSGKVEKGCYW